MRTTGSRRHIGRGQPFAHFGDPVAVRWVPGQVVPLLRILLHVVKFFAAIGIVDISPARSSYCVIALIVRRDCGPSSLGAGVSHLRNQRMPFQIISGR